MTVLLDWIIEGANYSRWQEGDRGTRDALVQETMNALMAVKIQHRSPAHIGEKIEELENRYRVAKNYLVEAERYADEDSLRVAVLKYFPHFYLVRAVMEERPPTRQRTSSDTTESAPSTQVTAPARTSDALVATVGSTPSIAEDVASLTASNVAEEAVRPITEAPTSPVTWNTLRESAQMEENRPRVSDSIDKSTRHRQPERVVEDMIY